MQEEDFPPVTFLLLTYNQENFITQAVESVLNQTYRSLDIIISDDCSTDSTYNLILKRVQDYHGPHKINLHRNNTNLGLIQHFNLLMSMVTTEYVIVGAGDDISVETRTEKIVAEFLSDPNIVCVHSTAHKINYIGNSLGFFLPPMTNHMKPVIQTALSMSLIIGATAAYKKELFSFYGPIEKLCAYEDLVYAFRAILLGKIRYLEDPLVYYRFGHGIFTSGSMLVEQNSCQYNNEQRRLFNVSLHVLIQRLVDLKKCRLNSNLNHNNYHRLMITILGKILMIKCKLLICDLKLFFITKQT